MRRDDDVGQKPDVKKAQIVAPHEAAGVRLDSETLLELKRLFYSQPEHDRRSTSPLQKLASEIEVIQIKMSTIEDRLQNEQIANRLRTVENNMVRVEITINQNGNDLKKLVDAVSATNEGVSELSKSFAGVKAIVNRNGWGGFLIVPLIAGVIIIQMFIPALQSVFRPSSPPAPPAAPAQKANP